MQWAMEKHEAGWKGTAMYKSKENWLLCEGDFVQKSEVFQPGNDVLYYKGQQYLSNGM